MPAPMVFFDIAGPDDEVLRSFYASVFDWELDDAGQFSVSVANPMAAIAETR